ncbi:MAG: hypothetical protein MRZ79_23395 [Bacteroidia bacterium]|nr:hypothetical protein [Bacteroidia bacterium]
MATTERLFIDKAIALEKRNSRISAAVTSILMILMLFFSLLMLLNLYREAKIGEGDEYEVVGSIDFGDYTNGSKKVNNYSPPVNNPVPVKDPKPTADQPAPSKSSTPTTTTEAQTTETTPTPSEVVTTKKPTPTTTPPVNDKPKENTSSPQSTTTETSETNNDNSSKTNSEEEVDDGLDFNMGGGSNEGDANEGTGNQGTPNTQILDPDGLFSFAESGPGSLKGRTPKSLPKPVYNTQQEGRIKFKIIIAPNGSVLYAAPAGPVAPNMQSLVNSGRIALEKWKFSAGQRQEVIVTITFKLK